MRPWIREHLVCPSCRCALELDHGLWEGEELAQGLLTCPRCACAAPILAGFWLSCERAPTLRPGSPEALAGWTRLFLGVPEEYESFLEQKAQRPVIDAYAAFMPFNESTRALLPLVGLLRSLLRPGDLLLDTWCRTGWQGEMLAGLFPEQRVVSLWEGRRGVLGPAGFRWWLPHERRAANLEIVFHDPGEPLPFADGCFAAVIGLDSLHRYRAATLVPECLRVCARGGVLIFPHVHLSNGAPEPFFERGGDVRHGREYGHWFGLVAGPGRAVFVLSERALFEQEPGTPLRSDPQTPHYNGLVMIAPAEWEGAPLHVDLPPVSMETVPIVNPLLHLDLDRQRVRPAPEALDGAAAELLARHPLYAAHLRGGELSTQEALLLFGAQQGESLGGASRRSGLGEGEVREIAASLAAREILSLLPVSAAMARLQRWYVHQQVEPPREEDTLPALWSQAQRRFPGRPWLCASDGSVFSFGDAAQVVASVQGRLRALGIRQGGSVAIVAPLHVESVLTFWAAALLGVRVCVADPYAPAERSCALLRRAGVGWCLSSAAWRRGAEPGGIEGAVLDEEGGEAGPWPTFSEWLEGEATSGAEAALHPEDPAVVLFTSGTTGEPKAVALSHGAVVRSARALTRLYGWRGEDRLLSTGALHTMSGLRNPVVATVGVGAALVLPDPALHAHPLAFFERAREGEVSLISTGPALLRRGLELRERLGERPAPSLRQVLSTADHLPAELAEEARRWLQAPVLDYYGLTETCGLCLAVGPDREVAGRGTLGWPVESIAQLVDEEGQGVPDGQPGELRIHNDRLMMGYLDDPDQTRLRLRGPWLYTGDEVVRRQGGALVHLGRKGRWWKSPGGERLALEEIERCLAAMPGVRSCRARVERVVTGPAALVVVLYIGQTSDVYEHEVKSWILRQLGPAWMPSRVEWEVGGAG